MSSATPTHWQKASSLLKQNQPSNALTLFSGEFGMDHYNFGLWLMQDQQMKLAKIWFEKLQKNGVTHPQLFHWLGICCLKLQQIEQAEKYLKLAIKNWHDSTEPFILLAQHYRGGKRLVDAENILRQLMQRFPNAVGLWVKSGAFFMETGEYKRAIPFYLEAIKRDAKHVMAHNDLGHCHQFLGEFEQAHHYFCQTIQLDPEISGAYIGIASSKKYQQEDTQTEDLILTQSNKIQDPHSRACIHFALGKILDDKQQYSQAWNEYVLANDTRSKMNTDWSQNQWQQNIERIMGLFSSDVEVTKPKLSIQPLFIVGMPRSGTTLLERELCKHPAITTAGEADYLDQIVAAVSNNKSSGLFYPDHLELKPDLEGFRQFYLQQMMDKAQDLHPKTGWIIDKNPLNFVHLGLIRQMFPDAIIIHCQRHSLDVLISCYFQNFSHANLDFSYKISDLMHFIEQYQKLMQFWKNKTRWSFLEIHYDDLVEQPAITLKNLTKLFINNSSEQITPISNVHQVSTASIWQARQPIYRDSLQRWKNYSLQLKPYC